LDTLDEERNVCCGLHWQLCKCNPKDVIEFQEVMAFAAATMDDVYKSKVCIDDCALAGTLSCKPYRTWLKSSYMLEEVKMVEDSCDDFRPWREMWDGYM
jgi:hypothetical protein